MITLDKKTAQQVLEALEYTTIGALSGGNANTKKAIASLRQALEQKPCDMGQMCLDCQPRGANGECPDQKTKQKPVGVVTGYYAGYPVVRPLDPQVVLCEQMALYIEPPQREWVGLTRGEKAHILNHCTTVASAVKAIEAKLQEKNT